MGTEGSGTTRPLYNGVFYAEIRNGTMGYIVSLRCGHTDIFCEPFQCLWFHPEKHCLECARDSKDMPINVKCDDIILKDSLQMTWQTADDGHLIGILDWTV